MASELKTTVLQETLEGIAAQWTEYKGSLRWGVPFLLPAWLQAWWDAFGSGWKPCVLTVKNSGRTIGIAPLRVRGEEACFIGDVNVCDYLDLITEPGSEADFLTSLLTNLRQLGVRHIDLRALRPESTAVQYLTDIAKGLGCEVSFEQEDVTYELKLPATWDEYLLGLSGHQRHEIRRKLRRLRENAPFRFEVLEEPEQVMSNLGTFLELFRNSRLDKAEFMNVSMTRFFWSVAAAMAAGRMVRLYLLEVDGKAVSAVLCFELGSTIYLYNNGFDRSFAPLSVGLLCKVLTIRESIERGCERYDFLKGAEPYKEQLGGKPVPLFRCHVWIH